MPNRFEKVSTMHDAQMSATHLHEQSSGLLALARKIRDAAKRKILRNNAFAKLQNVGRR